MQNAETHDKICVADKAVKPQIHLEEKTQETNISVQVWFCGCPSLFAWLVYVSVFWGAKSSKS